MYIKYLIIVLNIINFVCLAFFCAYFIHTYKIFMKAYETVKNEINSFRLFVKTDISTLDHKIRKQKEENELLKEDIKPMYKKYLTSYKLKAKTKD